MTIKAAIKWEIELMKWSIDDKLGRWKWYRRWRGGIWAFIRQPVDPFWCRQFNNRDMLRIIKTEDYATIKPRLWTKHSRDIRQPISIGA